MFRQIWLVGIATALFPTTALALAPAPTGAFIVASDSNLGLRWLDPQTGQILGILDDQPGPGPLTLGPNGLLYVGYWQERVVREMDPRTGVVTDEISSPAPIGDVKFGPDGRLYISAANLHPFGGIFVYDLATRSPPTRFNLTTLQSAPTGIDFGLDGDLFVGLAASLHGVQRLDGTTGAVEGFFTSENTNNIVSIAWGPDGNLYVGNQSFTFPDLPSAINKYSPQGAFLETLPVVAGNPLSLNFLPDGDLVWGRGGSDFGRFDFPTDTFSVFSSGYSFAWDTVLVPEPAAGSLLISAAISLRRRSKRKSSDQ
jgi:hypothetical protein